MNVPRIVAHCILLVTLALSLSGGCGSTKKAAFQSNPSSSEVITGTVSYLERVVLLPGSIVHVEFKDVSKADAPSLVLASQTINSAVSPPIPFSIAYDPSLILPGHRYSVQATISYQGRVLWATSEPCPVYPPGSNAPGTPPQNDQPNVEKPNVENVDILVRRLRQ